MSSPNEIEKQIKQNIEDEKNERAVKLFVNEEKNARIVSLDLSSKIRESAVLSDIEIPVDLNDSAFELLKKTIKNSNSQLLKIANEYHDSGREFYSFLYDCVSLAKYVDNLPPQFEKLTRKFSNAGDLMHNRIHAEVANEYKILGYDIDLERRKNGSKPDLYLDGIFAEVKTIISTGENTPKSFSDFARRVKERHDDEALEQINKDGMVFICMWSHVMNNIFKDYFVDRYSPQIPVLNKGKTVLTIEGKKAFSDFYAVFNSNDFSEEIEQFALSGYKRVSSFSYLGDFRRSGFPVRREGDANSMMQRGTVFRVG